MIIVIGWCSNDGGEDFKCHPVLDRLLKGVSVFIMRKKYNMDGTVVPHASCVSTKCFAGPTCYGYLTFSTPSAAQKLGKENR